MLMLKTEHDEYATVTRMHRRGEVSGTLKEVHESTVAAPNDSGTECAARERMAAE